MKKISLGILLLTALSSCQEGWDEETKGLFIQSCTSTLSKQFTPAQIEGYCNCALIEVIKAYPNQEDAVASGPALHQSKEVNKCKQDFLGIME